MRICIKVVSGSEQAWALVSFICPMPLVIFEKGEEGEEGTLLCRLSEKISARLWLRPFKRDHMRGWRRKSIFNLVARLGSSSGIGEIMLEEHQTPYTC